MPRTERGEIFFDWKDLWGRRATMNSGVREKKDTVKKVGKEDLS